MAMSTESAMSVEMAISTKISISITISISIPNHWEKVSLMTNDSIVQECFTFIDSSLSYTLNNEIVSFDSTSSFNVSANKSSIMLNEILWNNHSRKLILELAGKTSKDTLYSIYINIMAKTLEQTIGQLIIAGFRESTITPKSDILQYIKDYNISGVILYLSLIHI